MNLEKTIQEISDLAKSIESAETIEQVNEIKAKIAFKKAIVDEVKAAEEVEKEINKKIEQVKLENTPVEKEIKMENITEKSNIEVKDNIAEKTYTEMDVMKGFFGDKEFSMNKLTEKGVNVMGDRIRQVGSSYKLTLPEWFEDMVIGKNQNNNKVGKEQMHEVMKSIAAVNQSRKISKITPVMSTDSTGYATDSNLASTINAVFIPQLAERPETFVDLMSECTRVASTNGKAIFPKIDTAAGHTRGVRASRPATEATAGSETRIYTDSDEIDAFPLTAMAYLSSYAISRSGIDVIQKTVQSLSDAFRYRVSQEILAGTGSTNKMCQGIIGFSGTNEVARKVVGEIHVDDLVNLEYALYQGYRGMSKFVLDDTVEKALVKIKKFAHYGSTGTDTEESLFRSVVAGEKPTRLNGYSFLVSNLQNLAENDALADLGSKGDVVFGNFGFYYLAIERGITVARSDDFLFNQNTSAFRLDGSVGGKPVLPEAFAVLLATA